MGQIGAPRIIFNGLQFFTANTESNLVACSAERNTPLKLINWWDSATKTTGVINSITGNQDGTASAPYPPGGIYHYVKDGIFVGDIYIAPLVFKVVGSQQNPAIYIVSSDPDNPQTLTFANLVDVNGFPLSNITWEEPFITIQPLGTAGWSIYKAGLDRDGNNRATAVDVFKAALGSPGDTGESIDWEMIIMHMQGKVT